MTWAQILDTRRRWLAPLSLSGALALPALTALAQDPGPAQPVAGDVAKAAAEATRTSTAAEARASDGSAPGGGQLSAEEAQPPRPPTAAEVLAPRTLAEELAAREKELQYYQSGQVSFAEDMRALIASEYDEQKGRLTAQYDRQIEELETAERARRMEAIERFEEFLKKYPNDPVYTPDAMFRLAELYFEKSSDEYLARSKSYEGDLAAFERGERDTEPEPPAPSYEKTIGLHQDLLNRFPDYRLVDAARYLLGYCYAEQGQQEQALAAYLQLVEKHPKSKFLAEVWTRIGEIYFDGSDAVALENAIAAYGNVRNYPDSPYYDKALYKIAWTYYRLDRFDQAVAAFIGLVNYADEQKKTTGVSGSELRAEAIQYVAISLADETWGGLERAKKVLEPLSDKAYSGELWKRYGEILFDQTRYAQAIEILRYTLARYPNAPYNPEAQDKVVRAYLELRDFDGATTAREALVKDYSAGSTWYQANEADKEAIARAETLTERSLYTAALFRHQQAQTYKQGNKLDLAKQSYVAAASAYEKYLARFPTSKNAYDFEFFLAECLYYSGDYVRAAQQYDRVRDSAVDNRHLEAAAVSAVIAYEKEVERQTQAGAVKDYPLLTAAQRKGKGVEPKAIDAVRGKLVEASDRFARLLAKSERAPAIRYRAAEVYYRHDQFDEARKRFEAVVVDYPGSEVARYASNLIIESYLAVEDWVSVEKWSQRLIEVAQASDKPDDKGRTEFVGNLKTFKVGAQFKQAERFDAEGRYEDAANTYVRLVDENPKSDFADKALFNAAVAYEKVNRFDTASKIYQRIYDDYAASELAPRALFRVGINAEKGFDFSQAIATYSKLVERYPDSADRADALFNVAVVLENMQEYGRSAEAFKNYAVTFAKREDAGEVFFRSALVYEKMKAWPKSIGTLEEFIAKYGTSGAQKERIVQAYQKIGDAHRAQGNDRAAQVAYKACAEEYSRRRLSAQSGASAFAAECALQLAEADFRRYDALKISGSGKKQTQAFLDKTKALQAVEKEYANVFQYKRAEPSLAALYRIGYGYERFAEALFAAEIPEEFKNDEELAAEYKAQLEDRAAVLERKAEAAYRKAYDEAKRTRVTNEWTQLVLEGLNKYAPKEFPIQKQGKSLIQTFTISGNGLDDVGAGGATESKPEASGAAPGEARTAASGGDQAPGEVPATRQGGGVQ
jgi:TolA-binding protein